MENKFELKINETPDGVLILTIIGAVDGDAQFPLDLDLTPFALFRVDFRHVNFIDSLGIKRWVQFSSRFKENPKAKVIFENCPPIVVNQINNIEGFLPKTGVVDSLFVPIVCESCDRCFYAHLKTSLVNHEWDFLTDKVEAECENFPGCKRRFTIDVIREHYFRFTNR